MKLGLAKDVIPEVLAECQQNPGREFDCDQDEWARCRNYFMILFGIIKPEAVVSASQAHFLITKVVRIMRDNPHPQNSVLFPGMADVQLATFINTAQ